ncbi:MAG TPA: hypothetical protein VGL81_32905 [Polyangiaceae bacterium]|jgi:hypothetical protein
MPSKTPLAVMKEKFGDKAKLVEAIEKLTGEELWVARTNEAKGLGHVSNAKLLRLHGIFTEVKGKFGTREKLVDAILELEKRAKDAGYRQRLLAWPVPRLYDWYKSTTKRAGASKPADAKPAPAKKKAAAAPAAAKPAKKAAKKA